MATAWTSRHGQRTCPLAHPLGRGPAFARAQRLARSMSEQERLIKPRWTFRIFPVVSHHDAEFDLGEFTLRVPAFSCYPAGEVDALVAATCTLGTRLRRRVSDLFLAREPTLALALDRLGTEALYRLSDRLLGEIRQVAQGQGRRAGAQANPGDPGIGLEMQATVLAMAGAENCGVAVTAGGMLTPEKSLSFVVALGPDLPEERLFGRCRRCPSRDRCPAR